MNGLDGVWIPQGAEFCGEPIPMPESRFTISGERYVVEMEEQRDEGRLLIDASVAPAAIDVVGETGPNAGKTIPAIFRLRGELLQLCYDVGDRPQRPTAFLTAKGSTQLMVRYRRSS